MITAADINYTEEPFENLSVTDIHSLAAGDILIWCSGSGAGGNRNNGTYYILLDDGKGHCKYLEGDVPGASPNQAMLDGAAEAVGMIKKPSGIRLISACPLGFRAGFRGKGPNADRVQKLLGQVKQKGHSLSFSLADADVIKGIEAQYKTMVGFFKAEDMGILEVVGDENQSEAALKKAEMLGAKV